MLHAAHGYSCGMNKILIQAKDTDVLVLAIFVASAYTQKEMWLAFGHGNSFRYISAHGIAQQLDEQLSKGILFLHAFSGCDTVSSFCGISKKTAWNMLQSMKQVLPIFQHLSSAPPSVCCGNVQKHFSTKQSEQSWKATFYKWQS